jgi:hypothetical protein
MPVSGIHQNGRKEYLTDDRKAKQRLLNALRKDYELADTIGKLKVKKNTLQKYNT